MAEIETYDQVSSAPTNKVAAAGIAGSVSAILIWLVTSTWNVEIPPEIASAITTVISFASGYLVREKRVVS